MHVISRRKACDYMWVPISRLASRGALRLPSGSSEARNPARGEIDPRISLAIIKGPQAARVSVEHAGQQPSRPKVVIHSHTPRAAGSRAYQRRRSATKLKTNDSISALYSRPTSSPRPRRRPSSTKVRRPVTQLFESFTDTSQLRSLRSHQSDFTPRQSLGETFAVFRKLGSSQQKHAKKDVRQSRAKSERKSFVYTPPTAIDSDFSKTSKTVNRFRFL